MHTRIERLLGQVPRLENCQAAGTAAERKYRILIIDDDASVTASMKVMLELSGLEVTVAHDGLGGIKAAEAGPFDLLIVDIFMPEMDGFETLQVLRHAVPRCRPS